MAKFSGSVVTSQLSGSAGSVVFVTRRDGISYIKPRVTPRNPRTPLQTQTRERMMLATRAYQGLSLAQVRAWEAFALQFNSQIRAPLGLPPTQVSNLFCGLATKFLQFNGGGVSAVPTSPPPSLAVGDAVVLAVSSPGPGLVRVTASQANAAGMATEILLQPLPSATRKPRVGHYRFGSFVAFSVGSLFVDLPVSSRFVGVAARFLCPATGQVTGLVELGVVEVG